MEHFLATYQQLTASRLDLLAEIYTEDIVFIDPAHEIRGLQQLTTYFAGLYANIKEIRFDFHEPMMVGRQGYVQWSMQFRHPRLNGGRAVTVPGTSFLRFADSGWVEYHRDYFDLGALLYEHVPLLGGVVNALKRRMQP